MKAIKSINFCILSALAASVLVLVTGLSLAGCATMPQSLKASVARENPVNNEGAVFRSESVRPISFPIDADELWILSRGSETARATQNTPDSGALMAEVDNKEVPMPLAHTDVKASVSGYISTVDVTQQFNNPFDRKIEAVYVFPLPHNAAVNEFIMTIGKRRIRGIIRERTDAEQIYEEAKRQGYVATLLIEERPNIFRQSIANIEPGNQIDVNIKYFNFLDYVDGWYEFVFPMVAGSRINPTGTDGPDINFLKPNERSGHDISLRVDVDAGVQVEQIECTTHAITKTVSSPERFTAQLDPADSIPNKDFVLRYRVAGDKIKSSLLTQHDERGGYFTLMLYPPEELGNLQRQPLELVFVLDCSRSMSGRPIEQAKAAIARGLRLLRPGDTFQLISFSDSASQLGPAPVEATPQNIQRALNYLLSLNANDDNMMMDGIKAALDFPHDPARLRFVCFLTDGYIANEAEILGEIHQRLGDSRIFSFGLSSSPNRYLLDSMAKAGRGAVAYLGPHDSAAKTMEDFFERIGHPALTDIKIDWGAMNVSDVYPHEIPDLFAGRPVILTGRFDATGATAIHVTGNTGGSPSQFDISTNLSGGNGQHKGVASIWARMKIADLADQLTYAPNPQIPYEIRQVALDYGLVSPFTTFIAVDATGATDGAANTTVPVAVPTPDEGNHNRAEPEK